METAVTASAPILALPMFISCRSFTLHDGSMCHSKRSRVLREWTGTHRNIQHFKAHTRPTKRTRNDGLRIDSSCSTGPNLRNRTRGVRPRDLHLALGQSRIFKEKGM